MSSSPFFIVSCLVSPALSRLNCESVQHGVSSCNEVKECNQEREQHCDGEYHLVFIHQEFYSEPYHESK